MRHHPKHSFVEQSQPVNDRSPATDTEAEAAAQSPRALYLAANPRAAQLQEEHIKAITSRVGEYRKKVLKCAKDFVDLVNDGREIGLLVDDFIQTLPGKQLTLDFWIQLQGLFIDQYGNPITQDHLKYFVRLARSNPEPVADIMTAMRWHQPMLLAGEQEGLQLQGEVLRAEPQRIPPKDEYAKLTSWIENPDLEQWWEQFKKNRNYFPDGRLRPDLRAVLVEQWSPTFKVLDQLREQLEIAPN